MITKLTVMVILQYMHISDHYVVHLGLICQLPLSKTGCGREGSEKSIGLLQWEQSSFTEINLTYDQMV